MRIPVLRPYHPSARRVYQPAALLVPLQGPVPWEGSNFPGLVMLGAALAYVICRVRRVPLSLTPENQRLLDRGFGVVAGLIVLSLAGGVSTILILLVTNFRAYGRAGVSCASCSPGTAPRPTSRTSQRPAGSLTASTSRLQR